MKTQAAVIYEYKKPLAITAMKGFTGSMNPPLLRSKDHGLPSSGFSFAPWAPESCSYYLFSLTHTNRNTTFAFVEPHGHSPWHPSLCQTGATSRPNSGALIHGQNPWPSAAGVTNRSISRKQAISDLA